MKIVARTGSDDIAMVYVAETDNGRQVEFVESVQPPIPREKKWVLIISTLHGCPVGCRFCDAGNLYRGKLTKEEMLEQIDYLVRNRFPVRKDPNGMGPGGNNRNERKNGNGGNGGNDRNEWRNGNGGNDGNDRNEWKKGSGNGGNNRNEWKNGNGGNDGNDRNEWRNGSGNGGNGITDGNGRNDEAGAKLQVPVEKFKIQFARMGEPAFNENVLDVLSELSGLYEAPGLMPSISTIAPRGTDAFFERLLEIKNRHYNGRFQLQFSIHTTDGRLRDWLMPVKKWDLGKISEYGERFHSDGNRKITLNFALAEKMPVDPSVLLGHFDPGKFLVKITPVNPTYRARENEITSHILPGKERYGIIDALRDAGYEVILSIGELEENHIGSNCGQHVMNYMGERREKGGIAPVKDGYTYALE